MKHYCTKCRMTFHIRKAGRSNEVQRCPENGCWIRFWSGTTDHHGTSRAKASVGIDPEDAKYLRTSGEISELRKVTA